MMFKTAPPLKLVHSLNCPVNIGLMYFLCCYAPNNFTRAIPRWYKWNGTAFSGAQRPPTSIERTLHLGLYASWDQTIEHPPRSRSFYSPWPAMNP